MQAEIPPTLKQSNIEEQAIQNICPLCQTQLVTRSMAPISSTISTPQPPFVMCPSCGYSAPAIQRQHRTGQLVPTSNRRQPSGSSVWIDPTVSTYLGNNERQEYSPSLVPPTPKKSGVGTHHPIPQRASAQPPHPQPVKVRPKYARVQPLYDQQDNNAAHTPTAPPPMWQYDSPQFEVESSLPSLSLVVDAEVDASALVQPVVQAPRQQTISAKSLLELPLPVQSHTLQSSTPEQKRHITDIDEIDTLPIGLMQLSPSPAPKQFSPALARASHIDDIDTLPPGVARSGEPHRHSTDIDKADTLPPMVVQSAKPTNSTSLVLARSASLQAQQSQLAPHAHRSISPILVQNASAPTEQVVALSDPPSWTAGGVQTSAYARRIAERSRERKHVVQMQPLDHVRWWLLHPGRLEGLLWLGGTLLLLLVTFSLLIVTAVSLSWIAPSIQSNSSTSITGNGTTHITATSIPSKITANGLTLILENAGLIAPGQTVQLRGEGFSPLGQITFTSETAQPLLVQGSQSNSVQADGHGAFAATLLLGNWRVGAHHIVVRDVVSGRTANLSVILTSGPSSKSATPTVSTNATATSTTIVGGPIPTAVNATPPPVKTPAITPTAPAPTPTQVTPSPTPTMGVTPTNTPDTTPTAGTTPSVSPTANSQTQNYGNVVTSGVASLPSSNSLNPWVWLLIAGYSLAMLMLGLAGVLFRQR